MGECARLVNLRPPRGASTGDIFDPMSHDHRCRTAAGGEGNPDGGGNEGRRLEVGAQEGARGGPGRPRYNVRGRHRGHHEHQQESPLSGISRSVQTVS